MPDLPNDAGFVRHCLFPSDDLYAENGSLDVCLVLRDASVDSTIPIEQFLQEKLGPDVQAFGVDVMSEMSPRPDNRVTTTGDLDPSSLPKLSARCTIDAPTREAIDNTVRALGNNLLDANVGRMRIDRDNIFGGAGGGGHTMGTTRMGVDPEISVVDAECRVHGYSNLYVAGSSVFPSGGSVNPTLTIVALAHRLADHLIGASK